jgi:hypothetical protein
VHDTKVGRIQVGDEPSPRPGWLSRDSFVWLVLVAVLFLAAQLNPSLLRMPLGPDEMTYIAKTSAHASGVFLPPVHGHGVGLLAAPVTLFTTSVVALRIWMAVLSALGLFFAMLCWRRLRPAWVLAIAGLILASLAITQNSGVQVYPDWWAGVGILAFTGLFLHAVNGTMRSGRALTLVGAVSFLIVMMRPQNIVFILGPAIAAVLFVPVWRKPKVLVAMGIGIGLGLLEWAAEAVYWFGGVASRLTLAGQEPPSFRPYFSFFTQVKVLSGPWYCETPPRGCPGITMPGDLLWYVALLALVVVGLYAVWRTSTRSSSLLALYTGLWVVVLYGFLVPFGAPRYFLPTYALFAILAADGIAWLVTKSRWRTAGVVVTCAFLLIGIVTQQFVLRDEVASQTAGRPYAARAAQLAKLGIHAPCVVYSTSIAYYLGCAAPWSGGTMREVFIRTPQGRRGWRRLALPAGSPVVFVPTRVGNGSSLGK